jgi:hypothetical protein
MIGAQHKCCIRERDPDDVVPDKSQMPCRMTKRTPYERRTLPSVIEHWRRLAMAVNRTRSGAAGAPCRR